MENKLSPDKNKFQEWAEFCLKYGGNFWRKTEYKADFIPKKKMIKMMMIILNW